MAEFTFEIEEKLLVLSENDKGWTKELNRVSFNGAPAKYDIRTWSPDHSKWARELHFLMKNSKFSWMHLKTARESSISFSISLKSRDEISDS